jgi:hypothetical protein
MTWVDLSAAFAYGSQLTSTQMQNLRDNVEHLYQLGRNQLFSQDEIDNQTTSNNTSYSIVRRCQIYIPTDVDDLRIRVPHMVDNGAATSTIKARVTDDLSATSESSEETTSSTSYEYETLTVDCSGLSAGDAKLEILVKISSGAYSYTVGGPSAMWNQ